MRDSATKERGLVRILSLLLVAFLGTSCVPPGCIDRAFGSRHEHFVSITLFSEPIEEPKRRYSTGIGMWERFERGSSITIDARGSMAVSTLSMWPRSCPRIPREDLSEVSRYWQPLLEQMATPHTRLQVMANPYLGNEDLGNEDWRPDGSLLELTFGSAPGKTLALLWDGQSSLPGELNTAVIGTLEMVCSNSRLAKGYLFRDLPRQVTSRLECR